MDESIECTLCGTLFPVSEEDPDATVSDAVAHAATAHGYDPRLAGKSPIRLVENHEGQA